jgi:teichuronic acid exporter
MKQKRKVGNSILWSFINVSSVQISSLVLGIIFARYLGPEEFGLIASTSFFIGLSHSIAESGFGQALIRNKNSTQIDFSTAFYFNISVSLFLYVILFLSAPRIAIFFDEYLIKDLIRLIGLSVILQALTINQNVILSKKLDFKLKAKLSIPGIIISSIISLWMLFNDFGIWSFVCQILMLPFISIFFLWSFVKWRPTFEFSFESLKSLFTFGSRLLVVGILELFQKNIMNVVVSKFFTIRDLGFLNRAESLQRGPTILISKVVNRVVFPLLSNMNDNPSSKIILFQKLLRISAILIFPIMSFLIVFAKPIILVLLGVKWLPASKYLSLLAVSGLFYITQSVYQSYIKSEGRAGIILKIEIIRLLIMIPVSLFGIKYGILFFLYGLIIRSFLSYLIHVYVIVKIDQWKPYKQVEPIIFPLISSSLIAYASLVITEIFGLGSLSKLVFCSVYCFLMYAVLYKIFKPKDYDVIKMLIIK